jgi:hypothetical protein
MSAFSGNYNNQPLGLMDAVKGIFDRKDAKREQELESNRSHAQSVELAAMGHQANLESLHAQYGYETGLIEARGKATRRNASHAAGLAERMPRGSSMNVNETNINVSARSSKKSSGGKAPKVTTPSSAAPKPPAAPKADEPQGRHMGQPSQAKGRQKPRHAAPKRPKPPAA